RARGACTVPASRAGPRRPFPARPAGQAARGRLALPPAATAMTGPPVAAVDVAHLVKRYRRDRCEEDDDISFDVAEGQLFCLLGPNGAGYTTTVSSMTTTLITASGRASPIGRDLQT